MKNIFLNIYQVLKLEFKIIFKDKIIIIFLFGVPIAYPFLYSAIYNNEIVNKSKIVVVDYSNSSLSRDFIRKIDGSPNTKIIGKALSMDDAKKMIQNQEVNAILYIPYDFSKKINKNEQSTVSIYVNMSGLLHYKNCVLTTNEVAIDMGAKIRVEKIGAKIIEREETIKQAIDYDWVALYNPQNGFGAFMIPIILVIIIHQTLVISIGTIIGSYKDDKKLNPNFIYSQTTNISPFIVVIGRSICFLSIYLLFVIPMLFKITPYIFRLPQIGNSIDLILFSIPFLLTTIFFAMTLSYLVSNREGAMPLFLFLSPILALLSGAIWPLECMPQWIKLISYSLPTTPGIHGFIKINSMGATISELKDEFIMLLFQSTIYITSATLMHKLWLSKHTNKPHIIQQRK